jgi:uncharacterized membrane protein YoaK (UPF0700 family)
MTVPPMRVPRWVAGLLAFVAGVVDACTYFALFGLFVAQVTGSFVLSGVQIVSADPVNMIRTFAIPVFFFAGFATAFLSVLAGRTRKALCWALFAELVLVTGLVVVGVIGAPFDHPNAPLALTASVLGVSAMGVQSALVRLLMRGVASTNVMTTNTTLAAIDLAEWFIAARRAARHPRSRAAAKESNQARSRFAGLWPVIVGFLAGTVCGAIGFRLAGFLCLPIPILILGGLIVWSVRQPDR